jgi:uncharacterized protein (TIGR04255 family)
MAKADYSRRDVRGNLMSEVIFRIDYTGVIDVNDIVKSFAQSFDIFRVYYKTYKNSLGLGDLNYNEISETLAVPVKEIERQEIHRFTECKTFSDNVTFDISPYYTFLHIVVKEYKGLDPYLEFFAKYLKFIKETSPLISFKRFGLRKLGRQVFFKSESIFDVFEKQYFCTDFDGELFKGQSRQYADALSSQDERFKFTFKRVVDIGFAQNFANELVEAFQAVIDIDGFLDEEEIKKSNFAVPEVTKRTLEDLNNNLFELFKLGVTEEYLNSSKNEQTEQ